MLDEKHEIEKGKLKYAAYVNVMMSNGKSIDDDENEMVEGIDRPADEDSLTWMQG